MEGNLQTAPALEPIDPSVSLPDISDVVFPTEPVKPPEKSKNVINILLIGTDERSDEFSENARSDSMILISAKPFPVIRVIRTRDSLSHSPSPALTRVHIP